MHGGHQFELWNSSWSKEKTVWVMFNPDLLVWVKADLLVPVGSKAFGWTQIICIKNLGLRYQRLHECVRICN